MGKSFIFTVDSIGKIHDYSQLEELIKQAGEKTFSTEAGGNRIKQPDMIGDFIATQWFLWDSISSIPNRVTWSKYWAKLGIEIIYTYSDGKQIGKRCKLYSR